MSKKFRKYLIKANRRFLFLMLLFFVLAIILFIQKKYVFCFLNALFIPMICWVHASLKKVLEEDTDREQDR